MASTRPIASTEEVDIDEVIIVIIDVKDYKAIAEALITIKKALIKDLKEVNFKIEPNINKRNTISAIRQDTS